jgi:hypothetical protein
VMRDDQPFEPPTSRSVDAAEQSHYWPGVPIPGPDSRRTCHAWKLAAAWRR